MCGFAPPLPRHFVADPLNRDAGELLWKELLIHGGAKDPHEMLQALLGEQGSGGNAAVEAGVASLLKDTGCDTSSSSSGSGVTLE